MLKRLVRAAWARAALAGLAGHYLQFALATTRWDVDGVEHLAPHVVRGAPAVFAVWHERLPLMPALLLHARRLSPAVPPTAVLVSRHADGQLLGRLMARFGVLVVHGSTARFGQDRGGASGLRRLVEHLMSGGNVVITPDGPRGPRRIAAPGVAQLAAASGAVVVPCAAQTRVRRVLRTWDRMVLPLPWGRGILVCRPAIAVARDGIEAGLAAIAASMSDAADRADLLCRA